MLTARGIPRIDAKEFIERPLFLADWCEIFFMHFEVPPEQLQPHVPFPLDLYHGQTYVSLVAFTQKHLRPVIGGRLAAALAAPLAEHEFLNLRTYVRADNTRGIYFLSEWIPNRLAELIGPLMYGLPYQHGDLRYDNNPHRCVGRVRDRHASTIKYAAVPERRRRQATAGELDHFLLERYSAFTHRDGISRRFDVEHEPWTYSRATMQTLMPDLLTATLPFLKPPMIPFAQFSTGVRNVKIGWPLIVQTRVNTDTLRGNHCSTTRHVRVQKMSVA